MNPLSNKTWETEDKPEDRAKNAYDSFQTILQEQSAYRTATLQHLRLYRNLNTLAYSFSQGSGRMSAPLSLNVIRNMTNSVHSKITKNRVKTTMQTTGAGWERRELARKMDAYALGLTLKEGLHGQTKRAARDAIVTGTGHVKTIRDEQQRKIRFEWVFGPNLVVDLAEGAYMRPARKYEIMHIDRMQLISKFPEKQKEIEAANKTSGDDDGLYIFADSPSADFIEVIECNYVNPDNPKDGYRSFVINGGVELAGYKVETGCQYSSIRWSDSNIGWYGMGLAEELKGIQLEINRLVRKIQTAQGLVGTPFIIVDRTSSIARGHYTDIPGAVLTYVGKEPKVVAPQTVHPEIFSQLDRLYQRAYEIAGVSQLSAQSQKPVGFESGRQMLVNQDIESDRFADFQRQWEDLHVECIRKGINSAKGLKGYKVQVWDGEGYEELDFNRDIKLDEDEWTIHPMPAAMLGEGPAAQMQNAERMIESGMINHPEELLEQMDSPDIRAYVRRTTSPKRLVEKVVGSMLAGGKYRPPDPQMNLALALDIANAMYSEADLNEYPPERLQLVRDFMVRCKNLLKMAIVAPTPTQGAIATPGGPPPIPTGPSPGPEAPPAMAAPV